MARKATLIVAFIHSDPKTVLCANLHSTGPQADLLLPLHNGIGHEKATALAGNRVSQQECACRTSCFFCQYSFFGLFLSPSVLKTGPPSLCCSVSAVGGLCTCGWCSQCTGVPGWGLVHLFVCKIFPSATGSSLELSDHAAWTTAQRGKCQQPQFIVNKDVLSTFIGNENVLQFICFFRIFSVHV